MPGARELEDRVREYEPALVGYSGGVDSALVAVTACLALGLRGYRSGSLLDSNKPVREC